MDITKFIPHGKRNAVSGKGMKQHTANEIKEQPEMLTFCRLFGIINAYSFNRSLIQPIYERG